MKSKTYNFTVMFQKEPEGGYTAFVPLLPGCVSYGKDLHEAHTMITEAIGLYIEDLKAHKEDVPSEKAIFYSQLQIDPSKLQASYG